MTAAVKETFVHVLQAYYRLIKPGIIYANALTAVAGYLFGSKWNVNPVTFLGVTLGTSLVIAGACVWNNIIDRRIDVKMKRTKNRALVTGEISVLSASIFTTSLLISGFLLLGVTTNATVVLIGLIGLIDYVFLYGWAKRHTPFSTIIGSVSGSTSIIAGYCAAAGVFDWTAVLLFAILTLWQMPHFYGIAMYRKADYAAINLPLMPLVKSLSSARLRILAYITTLLIISVVFVAFSDAGIVSLVILVPLCLAWIAVGIKNYRLPADVWGKKMFLFSLIVNLGISLAVVIGSVTP